MKFGNVSYQSKQRVATVTLNRPERFNAIDKTWPDELAAAFEHAGDVDTGDPIPSAKGRTDPGG